MFPQKSFIPVPNFVFIILMFTLGLAFSYEQVCDLQDESSLLAFSATFSPSPPLNWSSSSTCCEWEGIVCDTHGRVITLNLYSRGLKGIINDTIGNLVSLTHLNLSNNDLHGTLSDKIIGLINLRTIDLSANTISGPIPPKIGNLLYLEILHLQYNNLSGPIPPSLMSCTNLIDIFLGDNHLEGDISTLDLSKLIRLQKLDLLNNTFNGTLPKTIYSCKSLVAIRVAANNLRGQISPKILEFKYLSYLSITQNSFINITKTLAILANCNNLTTLFLGANFHGESLPSSSNFLGSNGFPQLQYLSLDGCNLTGSFPEWLSNIKTLRAFSLNKNKISGKIPSWMGNLPNLFRVELSSNHLYGEIPKELCQLPALMSERVDPKLSQFKLEFPFFSLRNRTREFEQYSFFASALKFSNNKLSGHIPPEIGRLHGIQQMEFGNNLLTGDIPVSISHLTNLERLVLSENHLTGEIPASLTNLNFLSHLDLSYNSLEGRIPTGGQFNTFEQKAFEGNPQLCGELVHRSCSNTPNQPIASGYDKRQSFLQGLYVGLASGFSGILVIVASYLWFSMS